MRILRFAYLREERNLSIKNSFNSAINNDLQKNPKLTTLYSWPVIVLFLVFFFPVAIFLIYKRFNIDKTNILKNSKITRNFGIAAILLGLLYAIMALTGNVETTEETMNPVGAAIIMLSICSGGGLWLLLIANKMNKNGLKYKKYVKSVINQGHAAIDNIAANVGVTYETALEDLYKMMEQGYFGGSYINETNREIVLPKASIQNPVIKEDTKVESCKGCGANNTVFIGRANSCEYCGSPIEI